MAYYPATPFVPQFTNDAGVPLSGGTLTAYVAGDVIPTNMFVDAAGTSAGSVITLNARGEPQVSGNTVVIWLNDAVTYKFVLKDASGTSKWTIDNISQAVKIDGLTPAAFFVSRANRVVDSIAALKALDKTKFTRAFVTGYYTAGDGGGGHYWYDSTDTTSADNGGTIIVATDGGRWKLTTQTPDVYAEQFGAKGDGVTDDRVSIQAAIDWIYSTGRAGTLRTRGKTYGIGSSLTHRRGVSWIGEGMGMTYALSDDVNGTRVKWLGAGSGTMLEQTNRWIGTLEGIIFDGNNLATRAVNSIGVCNSTYRNILVENFASGNAWVLTTTGALHPDGVSQWPSCAANIFEKILIRDVDGNAMVWDGTINGANATIGAVTENILLNCRFIGGNNSVGFVMNKCCDTNWSYGGEYSSISGASGAGLVLNYSADNNQTFGNHFYGGVIVSSDGSGSAIQCRNNDSFNIIHGAYMVLASARVTDAGGGKVKLTDCLDLSGTTYSAPGAVVPSGSPWTYTNTNPYALEFEFWGGTISLVERMRNGVFNTITSIQPYYNLWLQPGDGVRITYTVAPSVFITPQ